MPEIFLKSYPECSTLNTFNINSRTIFAGQGHKLLFRSLLKIVLSENCRKFVRCFLGLTKKKFVNNQAADLNLFGGNFHKKVRSRNQTL